MDHESGMGAKAPLSGYEDCNLHEMTKEQVRQWLSEKQISKDVVDSLYTEEITGEDLLLLIEDTSELKEIIPRLKDRLIFKKAVKSILKADCGDKSKELEETRDEIAAKTEKGKEPKADILQTGKETSQRPIHIDLDSQSATEMDIIIKIEEDMPLPNPFPLPKLRRELQVELASGIMQTTTIKEVAKEVVNAICLYSTHPKPKERNRVARQLVTKYPILAASDDDIPEQPMSQEIRHILKEKNRTRRPRIDAGNSEPKRTKIKKEATKGILPQVIELQGEDHRSLQRHVDRLLEEYEKSKPSVHLVDELMKITYSYRRNCILQEQPMVRDVIRKYPFLTEQKQFLQEVIRITGCNIHPSKEVMQKVMKQAIFEKNKLANAILSENGKDCDAVAPETVVGLRLLCPLLSIKASKIDPDNVCRKIIASQIVEECLCEKAPIILYDSLQCWLSMEGLLFMEVPPAEAPEFLLGAYYIFNFDYKEKKPVMTFLEKVIFNKYFTSSGKMELRLMQAVNNIP